MANMSILKRILIKNTIKAIVGVIIFKYLRVRYGKNIFIFITRGKMGDIYLYFRFLENFIKKKNIDKYIFIGDCKNLEQIKTLYPNIKGDYIKTSERIGSALQITYCLLSNYDKNIALNLMWDVDLPYNRCAVRLTKKFNFVESYYWFLFDLDDENCVPAEAIFNKLDKNLENKLKLLGVEKNKTVILSPYAYCVRNLDPLFWIVLGKDLENRGYKIFVMLDPKSEKNLFGYPTIFFKYADTKAILEYAGNFIALRSGFCDIMSSSECNKVILYPTVPKKFDGSVHRSDIKYSSLQIMRLTNNVTEITVPFARDIVNFEAENENFEERINEFIMLKKEILNRFAIISLGVSKC